MQRVVETANRLVNEALNGLEKGYNAIDLKVLGEAVDILKDVRTIQSLNYSEDIPGTEIDDNIVLMNKNFREYIEHKKSYQKSKTQQDKTEMMHSLEKFLYAMMKILEEMKSSSDFAEEREMVKGKLREMFNLYQNQALLCAFCGIIDEKGEDEINWKVRFKNPVFWVQILVSIVLTALSYNSMQPADLTSWSGFFELVKGIVTNPYLLALCAWNVWSAVNDPTTAGVTDSAEALTYAEPKKGE